MRALKLFFLVMVLTNFVYAAKVARLSEINAPETITVDKNQFFITEEASIYIYSLDNFKVRKKFGKRGEGPQEFLVSPDAGGLQINVQPDYILASSIGKISYFTRNGDFIKEIKAPRAFAMYQPLGKGFAGTGFARDSGIVYATINLYDSQLNKIKEIHRHKNPYQVGQKMNPFLTPPFIYTMDNKIIVDPRNGPILVFNHTGEKYSTIDYKYEKIKLESTHKKQILDFYRTNPKIKQNWERIKNLIEFPNTFPDIQQCTVKDGKIYAQTYRKKENQAEFFIFDLKGKRIKKLFLPLTDMNILKTYPYTIQNNMLYQLIEDEEAEVWELHRNEIK